MQVLFYFIFWIMLKHCLKEFTYYYKNKYKSNIYKNNNYTIFYTKIKLNEGVFD